MVPVYTALEPQNLHVGDIVKLKPQYCKGKFTPNRRYRVTKFMVKNIEAVDIKTGSPVRGRPSLFVLADDVNSADVPTPAPTVTTSTSNFEVGEVVVVTPAAQAQLHNKWTYSADQKFVVIKLSVERVNIVRLGGEGGKYWRMFPASLTHVSV